MAGTDVTSDDGLINHDHTYIGNGCPGGDDAPDSFVSCSTNIAPTADSENLVIGSYYNYMAATTGSGGTTLSDNNTITPDTFCPLGWQLPYGGTGGDYYDKSKSYKYLLDEYGYMDSTEEGGYGAMSYPLSNNPGGRRNSTGGLRFLGSHGYYFTSTVKTSIDVYRFATAFGTVISTSDIIKNMQYPIRCVDLF